MRQGEIYFFRFLSPRWVFKDLSVFPEWEVKFTRFRCFLVEEPDIYYG